MSKTKKMTFIQALKKLGIEEYAKRIINSNSHGELFHCQQYLALAQTLEKPKTWFPEFFKLVVESAQQEWERPESVFQHITTILIDQLEKAK